MKKRVFFGLVCGGIAVTAASVAWLYLVFLLAPGIMLLPPLIMFVGGMVFTFFARRRGLRIGVDYDYVLTDEVFTIASVFNLRSRRLLAEFKVKSAVAWGRVDSPSCKRYEAEKEIRRVLAAADYEGEGIYFALFNSGGEKTLLYFQPDEEFLRNLRLAVGRDLAVK